MIVYHGSKMIVESPEIRIAKYNKDFYFGFYCTLFPEQAIRWATRFNGTGYLNEYLYTPNEHLNVKIFPEMTEEWLDFIVSCRLGHSHNYDIVEGPMADDTIWNFVNDYLANNISKAVFWEYAKFKHPTHQISFHSIRALGCLQYERSEIVNDEEME